MGRHQPHLLVERGAEGDVISVDQRTRRHLETVLRIGDASPVTYTDGFGLVGSGTYDGGVIVRGDEQLRPRHHEVAVAVAPPRDNARVRFVVEKLTELGVARLIWLDTKYREGRAPRSDKAAGWVRSALEQSRGVWLMEIVGSFPVASMGDLGTPVFADPSGRKIDEMAPVQDPVLCVGPEGGFARDELPADAVRVCLSPNVLRVETAAVVGAAQMANAMPMQAG